MAKKARVWTGTEFVELASAQTDLTAYSTTAQMNTAITAGVGLVPILTQTIGTAVSSVVVSNAFSATYDSYKIVITGGVGSTTNVIGLKLGATATGYYSGLTYSAYATASATGRINNNASSWSYIGIFTTSNISFNVELTNPFLAKNTLLNLMYNDARVGGEAGAGGGFLNDSTSYTDFTITTASGTLTGGTIKVYGYKN